MSSSATKSVRYRWVFLPDGRRLSKVGVYADGSLYNPNGYPDELVRAAVGYANERRRVKRSEAAKRASVTRRRRQEMRVYDTARRLVAGGVLQPALKCIICGKQLGDPESHRRGIGSDCWQDVLAAMERLDAEGDDA